MDDTAGLCVVCVMCVMVTVPEEDPNAEPCHWLEVEQAKRTVYCQRFSLPDGVVEDGLKREKKVW